MTAYRRVQALEASEHRLLMEVDHRAKNVLAIVDSIVRLSKSDNAAAYASAVQHRVQSLAQAHALLSSASWRPVTIRRLIKAQIARYGTVAITMSGPEILVAPEVVQPLSLVIHELAVNALSHGSLSRPGEGTLRVGWRRGADDRLHLDWDERGGKIKPHDAGGFGDVIMRALIERQLQGSIKRDWRADGVKIAMDIVTN